MIDVQGIVALLPMEIILQHWMAVEVVTKSTCEKSSFDPIVKTLRAGMIIGLDTGWAPRNQNIEYANLTMSSKNRYVV